MDTASPKICAVVLNITGTSRLVDCLLSLDKTVYQNLEIIVVHNGPYKEEFENEVRRASAKIAEVVFTGYNAGFAAGNNTGIKRALKNGAEYVLLLNDDTAAARDFIDRLVSEARKDPARGMLGPRINYFSDPGKIWFSGAAFNRAECAFSFPGTDQLEAVYGRPEAAETAYVTGCALLASRKLIETVGMLDERYFLYWEDADWGLRALKAGFVLLVVPAAKVLHKVSSSSGGNDSPLKIYHKTRGQLLFASTHAPSARGRLLFGFIKDIAWLLLKSGRPDRFLKARAYAAGAADYLLGRIGPGPSWLWQK